MAARFDRIVLEGAGSPVEINLIEHDLTNLRMARHADASVVLVADIENCRVLRISPARRIVGSIGAAGRCAHDPPRALLDPKWLA